MEMLRLLTAGWRQFSDVERRAGVGLSAARTLNTLERRALVFKKLPVVRRCVPEGIIKVAAVPLRGVHKGVDIFLDIDRVEEQAFVSIRLTNYTADHGAGLLGLLSIRPCGGGEFSDSVNWKVAQPWQD